LKSANIFICEGRYKLGDLNVSKVNDHEQRLVRTQTGTPFYASPEVWRDEPYGSPSDVWSLGCILYEMCYLRPPFQGKDLNELYKNVQRGEYEPIPKIYSRELEQIIQSCLKQKAKERPTADQLLREGGSVFSRCDYYDI
jgi:NIMA (never in mitosis gene a)-related kinase